jgi:hypothetical protein
MHLLASHPYPGARAVVTEKNIQSLNDLAHNCLHEPEEGRFVPQRTTDKAAR